MLIAHATIVDDISRPIQLGKRQKRISLCVETPKFGLIYTETPMPRLQCDNSHRNRKMITSPINQLFYYTNLYSKYLYADFKNLHPLSERFPFRSIL